MATQKKRTFEEKLPEYATIIAGGTESAAYVTALPHLFAGTEYPRENLHGVVDARTTLDPNSATDFFYASTRIELPPEAVDVIATTELLRLLESSKLWSIDDVLKTPEHPQFSNVQNMITRFAYDIELISLIVALKNGDSYEIDGKDLLTGEVTGLSSLD